MISWAGIGYLLVVYVVWGSTYLAIRIAVREGAGFLRIADEQSVARSREETEDGPGTSLA